MDSALVKVLEQAGSQDPNILKPAEQILKQWETQRGFYTTLYNVFSNQLLPINVRWMAIVYFKNGIDRYWRKNALGEIADDEKEFLRRGLMCTFDEPVNQLAIQLAVLIGKIARYDCPKEWSSLVPTLLEIIRGNNNLAQHRALLTFHHTVKALASKRLAADRKLFHELTSNVFAYVLNFWNTYTESFITLTSNGSSHDQINQSLEKALLSLRILRKLIVNGISKPSDNPNAILFLKVIFQRLKISLECRKNLKLRGIDTELCDKFVIHLTKVLLGVLESHPLCYIDCIPASLDLVVFYCFTESGQLFIFERFVIQCLNLLKKILQTSDYKSTKIIEDTDQRLAMRAHQLKQEFFTPPILTEICTRLVTNYFRLTTADLELWDTDPENFGVDDCGESWKYSLRPCTEAAFLTILHQFKDTFANVLVELIQRHHHPVDPNDLQGILLKDAVYNAVGLAGFDLYDEVNFDQWFTTTLKEELKEKSSNYRIIRRRICWLMGRWTGVKLSVELRPELYDLMLEALNPEEDLGVRLAASDALKLAIDDFQFNADDFSPFLERAFSLLFSLLKEVNEYDTKMRVLYVLSFMIERVGSGMKPHIEALNVYLPTLWQQSQYHNMLRCAIVSTLVHLEKALGSDSVILQPLVVNVVDLSCDINQEGHIYLLEEGLELWLAFLENTPFPTPEIMNLFKNIPPLLESSSDNLRLCLYIVQAYVLLNPHEILSEKGCIIVNSLKSIMGDLRPEGIVMIMELLELCLRTAPKNAIQLIKPLLFKIFESVYKGSNCHIVLTMYISIIARILLNSRESFVEVIQELARKIGQHLSEDTVFTQIIHIYLDHMPLVITHKTRKLLALALCSLLNTDFSSILLQQFPKIMTNIVETLNDIMIIDNGYSIDSLIIDYHHSPSHFEDLGYESENSQRKRKLAFEDPVHCIVLDKFLQNQLHSLRKIIGNEQFDIMIQSLNLDVKQQLREYIQV